ncbi:MAG: F0F1 ATP synthase subunit B [Verrucomicrobiales bacterium]|jgi:F-type H+-transporting ATPase subunit b|nr:F0F1 ATP synthase subunit B [Verrucomicrobiales bacterium]MBP9224615.1 F0F1 ATP synthase subunit B [Verrucomicrobiales bacterium]HQZ26756.1 F0F1 ATP synthase subunit B [Verrucomicrobiales bacterium]
MEDILKTFGLEWPKFISQVIIVLLVYFILSKYAFGPVLAMLDARRRRIAEGESNLKTIELELGKAEERVQGMLDRANQDAERLIAEARDSAEAVRGQKTQEAIKEAQAIIEKAREASRLEHESALSELKRDFGRLVIDATSKVTGKVLNEGDQKRINEEAVGQVAL